MSFLKTVKCLNRMIAGDAKTLRNERLIKYLKQRSTSKRSSVQDAFELTKHHSSSEISLNEEEIELMQHELKNNRNFEDVSVLNHSSSLEQLFSTNSFKEKNKKSFFFMHRLNRFKFYFKIIKILFYSNDEAIVNQTDLRDASFIFFTDFLVGLGIVTVLDMFYQFFFQILM
jgi:hypothetical protein